MGKESSLWRESENIVVKTPVSLRRLPHIAPVRERQERVLVTGASGLLGREVALDFLRRGYQVRLLQRRDAQLQKILPPALAQNLSQVRTDLSDKNRLEEAINSCDGVVHLAAKVSFTGTWEEFYQTNVQGTQNLLQAAAHHPITRFLYISSPSVAHTGVSFMGADNTAAAPEHTRGYYARSKAIAEHLVLAENSERFHTAALRPHIVWGPSDTQLVERVLERAAAGRLPLLNDGTALIDTTYIDNAVDAIVTGYERLENIQGQALVITNGQPRPVAEIIHHMCTAVGIEPPKRSVPATLARALGSIIEKVWEKYPGEDEPPMTRFLAEQLSTAHWFDQRRTQKLLDWAPKVSLEEGYERLAQFYQDRYRH